MPNSHKTLFLMEEGITYLNCANMSPMLTSVKEAGLQAIETRAAPWKLSSADWFMNADVLRDLAATIFQTDGNNIALVPSVSYGIAVAAKNLKLEAGKEIIVLDQQFPSNYHVWETLARQQNLELIIVKRQKGKTLTECILEKINRNTGIITIPNCHWIDGVWIDLHKVRDAARTVGSYFVLDLSQSLGVLPIEIESLQPDFAVSVGYKWLLGPYSLGYMYVSKKWQETGEPLEYSWQTRKGSDDFAGLTNYAEGYRDGARKFDMGEFSQFNLLPMAIAGLKQLIHWEINFIQTEIIKLSDRIVDFKTKLGIMDDKSLSVGHITSIPLHKLNMQKVKDSLQENKVVISFRGTSIRVSPHLYNDFEDIDRLLSCLEN